MPVVSRKIVLITLLAAKVAYAEEPSGVPVRTPELPSAQAPAPAAPPEAATPREKEAAPSLDFDLLGDLPPVAVANPVDEAAVKQRRFMLTVHQSVGIALAAAMVGSLVTGQLNYNDKFLDGNSARYEFAHQLFVYPTIGLGAIAAGLALFAPEPIEKSNEGFDRSTLHKIGEFTAALGWLAQLGLGLWVSSHEGMQDQKTLAQVHLAVGYVSLAGMLTGIGSVVF